MAPQFKSDHLIIVLLLLLKIFFKFSIFYLFFFPFIFICWRIVCFFKIFNIQASEENFAWGKKKVPMVENLQVNYVSLILSLWKPMPEGVKNLLEVTGQVQHQRQSQGWTCKCICFQSRLVCLLKMLVCDRDREHIHTLSLHHPSSSPSSGDNLQLTPHPFPVRTDINNQLCPQYFFWPWCRELERCW